MSHPIRRHKTLQSAVFLLNSRLTHFTAAHQSGHPLSRSYGAIMPSSLTRFHSCALVYSTHPPVSVYGTGSLACTAAFLGDHFEGSSLAVAALSDCSPTTFSRWALSATASLRFKFRRCGNINPLSIAYAYRPRLRSRLTLG